MVTGNLVIGDAFEEQYGAPPGFKFMNLKEEIIC